MRGIDQGIVSRVRAKEQPDQLVVGCQASLGPLEYMYKIFFLPKIFGIHGNTGAYPQRRHCSEVQEKTRSKNIKDTSIHVIPQLTVFWDKHITLRITAMLLRSALKLEDGDST
jgi:hypothetical protein